MDFFVVVAVVRRFEQSTKQQPFSVQCFCGKILKKGPHFMCALYSRLRERERERKTMQWLNIPFCSRSHMLLFALCLSFYCCS